MIVTRLMGGLGNQMFQYAAGRRLALHRQTELKLDLSWLENEGKKATAVRTYELDCFNIAQIFADPKDLSNRKGLLRSRKSDGEKISVFNEDGFAFDKNVLNLPDNTLLSGYWQSEKYFKDIADTIRSDFTFMSPPKGKSLEIAERINNSTSISLHVRRGDYATNKETNVYHGLAPIEYYNAAVAKIMTTVQNPHFYVFSDDPEWTKEHIKLRSPATYVDHNSKGAEDMRLMSMCQHHIIANSSFSWWAAWLNPSTDKIVIAPKQWFNLKTLDTSDLIPASWIRL